MLHRWALVSQLPHGDLAPSELDQIAAAVDVQVTRDLPQHWPHALAAIQAFADPAAVPLGYSPALIVAMADMPEGALGFHYTEHRLPAAKIGYDPANRDGLPTTVSHEVLEGTADPSGNRLVPASIVMPGDPSSARRVLALVEVADPPEAYGYLIDGLSVSDFVTQGYYGPQHWRTPGAGTAQGSFTFCGRLNEPLQVAPGGYLSFVDPATGVWEQITWFDGAAPATRVLGRRDDDDARSHREWIDSQTANLRFIQGGPSPPD